MASVPLEDFVLEGAAELGCHESSPGKKRYFCKHCGTQIYTQREGNKRVGLSLSAIDTDLPVAEFARIWMSDRARWYDPDSSLPRYDKSWRDGK